MFIIKNSFKLYVTISLAFSAHAAQKNYNEIEEAQKIERTRTFVAAVKAGDHLLIQELLKLGINPNYRHANFCHMPILCEVIKSKNIKNKVEIIQSLIALKADINIEPKPTVSATPIEAAVTWGNFEIVKLLVDSGTNVSTYPELMYKAVVRYSNSIFEAQDDAKNVIKFLLDHKANVLSCGKLNLKPEDAIKNVRSHFTDSDREIIGLIEAARKEQSPAACKCIVM